MAITLDGTNGITTPDVIATSQSSNFVTTGNISATDLTLTGAASATDLTLSGGVYLGGTGSANYLDDYEEGTWTPSLFISYGSGSVNSQTTQLGTYTKIGRLVVCSVQIFANITNSGANFGISGLPFTVNLDASHTVGGGREEQQTGNWFQAEGATGTQITVLRRYDNAGPPSGNVEFKFIFSYPTT